MRQKETRKQLLASESRKLHVSGQNVYFSFAWEKGKEREEKEQVRALKVSIVIPTFNERRNISILIPRVVEVLRKNRITGEIIVVDDNSEDGTADEVRRLARKFGGICEIRLIERGRKMGIGSAYKTGFAHAKGDILFEMDGDLSHNPALIPAFLRKLHEEKCEVVIGSRYVRGGA